jgi:hypothetical protein
MRTSKPIFGMLFAFTYDPGVLPGIQQLSVGD